MVPIKNLTSVLSYYYNFFTLLFLCYLGLGLGYASSFACNRLGFGLTLGPGLRSIQVMDGGAAIYYLDTAFKPGPKVRPEA